MKSSNLPSGSNSISKPSKSRIPVSKSSQNTKTNVNNNASKPLTSVGFDLKPPIIDSKSVRSDQLASDTVSMESRLLELKSAMNNERAKRADLTTHTYQYIYIYIQIYNLS